MENVIEEWRHLVKDLGALEIGVLDDSANIRKQRLVQLADGLIAEKLNHVPWIFVNGIRANLADYEMLKKLKQAGLKLEFRSGYYAPLDFAHSGRDDRAQQMQEQLLSDLPITDLPVHGSAGYFRLKDNRYFVPVWFIVPGSQVQFTRPSDKEKATLDVLGVIRDGQNRPVAWIQDTVKLAVAATEDVRRRNVQYGTSFELPPGLYRLKVVIRENQLGTFGSFDSTLVVPPSHL